MSSVKSPPGDSARVWRASRSRHLQALRMASSFSEWLLAWLAVFSRRAASPSTDFSILLEDGRLKTPTNTLGRFQDWSAQCRQVTSSAPCISVCDVLADSTVSEKGSTSEMEATKAPLPMATDEDSEYDQSGGSREGAYCGTRAKPQQTSGGEAIRRADNLSFRTGHHPPVLLGGVRSGGFYGDR